MQAGGVKSRAVLPGDYLCAPEEFMPGSLTYVRGGEVRAAVPGIVLYDYSSRRVIVKPFRRESLRPVAGSLVIGVVTSVKEDSATISILMDNKWRSFGTPFTGILHVSHASRQYTRSITDAVRLGDLVRVKVLRDTIPMHVSMRDAQLGVLAAYCSQCGALLVAEHGSNMLKCPRCGNTEPRKLAPDYMLRSRGRRRSGEAKK